MMFQYLLKTQNGRTISKGEISYLQLFLIARHDTLSPIENWKLFR